MHAAVMMQLAATQATMPAGEEHKTKLAMQQVALVLIPELRCQTHAELCASMKGPSWRHAAQI